MKKTYGENILEEKIEIDKFESDGIKIKGLKYTREILYKPGLTNNRDERRNIKASNHRWLAILKKVWPIVMVISLELIPEIIRWVFAHPEIIVIIVYLREIRLIP